jgi:hypothetical protein
MPAMLWQHDSRRPIGVWQRMREDGVGLQVAGRLALATRPGAEAYELLKLGAVSGLSIGYVAVASQIDERTRQRVLTDVDLWEVSLVTFPANPAARVTAVKAEADAALAAAVRRLRRRTDDLNRMMKGR